MGAVDEIDADPAATEVVVQALESGLEVHVDKVSVSSAQLFDPLANDPQILAFRVEKRKVVDTEARKTGKVDGYGQ